MRRGRFLAVLAVLLVALLLPTLALGESLYNGFPTALLLLDGQLLTPDVPPIIVNGRVLVPLRAVAEAFGAEVGYNAEARTVIINGSAAQRAAALQAENQVLRAALKAAGVQPVSGPIVISGVNTLRDSQGYVHILGVAKNTGKSAYSLLLVGSFTGAGQKVLAVANGSLQNLAPGEGRPFELVTTLPVDVSEATVTVQVDSLLPPA